MWLCDGCESKLWCVFFFFLSPRSSIGVSENGRIFVRILFTSCSGHTSHCCTKARKTVGKEHSTLVQGFQLILSCFGFIDANRPSTPCIQGVAVDWIFASRKNCGFRAHFGRHIGGWRLQAVLDILEVIGRVSGRPVCLHDNTFFFVKKTSRKIVSIARQRQTTQYPIHRSEKLLVSEKCFKPHIFYAFLLHRDWVFWNDGFR